MSTTNSPDFKSLSEKGRFEEIISIAENIIEKEHNEEAMYWVVHSYTQLNRFDKGRKLAEDFLKIMGKPRWLCKLQKRLGAIHLRQGETNRALEIFLETLDTHQNTGDMIDIAGLMNNIGIIYGQKGNFTKALDFHEESLKLREQLDNMRKVAGSYLNIGIIYYHKKEYDTALENYNTAQRLFFEINANSFSLALTCYYKIRVLLKLDEDESVDSELKKLNELVQKGGKPTEMLHQLSYGLYLKSSQSLKDRAKAQIVFEDFLDEYQRDYNYSLVALKSLTDLLLDEYRLYHKDIVLNEIRSHIDHMSSISAKNDLKPMIVETTILKGKLHEIEGNLPLASKFYENALDYAKSHHLEKMVEKATKNQERFEENLSKIENLLDNNADIIERIEFSAISEYLDAINI